MELSDVMYNVINILIAILIGAAINMVTDRRYLAMIVSVVSFMLLLLIMIFVIKDSLFIIGVFIGLFVGIITNAKLFVVLSNIFTKMRKLLVDQDKDTLLIVDDEGLIHQDIQRYFEKYYNKYYIKVSATVDDAINVVDDKKPRFAIIDLDLGKEGELAGIKIIEHILRNQRSTYPIVLSGSSFEDKKQDFERVFTSPEELEKIKKNYVHKGSGNYILALIDKLEEVEKQKS